MILLSLLSSLAIAGTTQPFENQCRLEAKEVALKSYSSCVSAQKAKHLAALRKDYQARMNELKNEFDSKIKELMAKPEPNSGPSEMTVKLKKQKTTTDPVKQDLVTPEPSSVEVEMDDPSLTFE